MYECSICSSAFNQMFFKSKHKYKIHLKHRHDIQTYAKYKARKAKTSWKDSLLFITQKDIDEFFAPVKDFSVGEDTSPESPTYVDRYSESVVKLT
jgi:hypothetical protein